MFSADKRRQAEVDTERLRRCYIDLLDAIEAKLITPYMYENGALEFSEKQEINSGKNRLVRATRLLDKVNHLITF